MRWIAIGLLLPILLGCGGHPSPVDAPSANDTTSSVEPVSTDPRFDSEIDDELIERAIREQLDGLRAKKSAKTIVTPERAAELLETPLEFYRVNVGDYPSTEAGLEALLVSPSGVEGWQGPYLNGVPTDPWGSPFQYKYPGTRQDGKPDLWSPGPDKIDGTEDDIFSDWD